MVSLNLLLVATVWTYWNHEPADHLRRMSSSLQRSGPTGTTNPPTISGA